MDEKRLSLRASDDERQEAVDVLKEALDHGRLRMDEYVDRMGLAYEAVTYGELVKLQDDLPAADTVAKRKPGSAPAASSSTTAAVEPHATGFFADQPTAIKVLWTVWATAVSINLMVWLLVGVTTVSFPYPWPIWVAGPAGSALTAVSLGTRQIRRNRRATRKPLPPLGS